MNCIGQASWRTKEDMLEDLSAIGQTRINDDYLVIGERPPPPLREVDDEYDLRYGGTNYGDVSVTPDLNGIRQCLRMVDQSDDEEEPILNHNGPIVISKLNPLVQEFVPRTISSTSQRVVGDNASVTKSPRKSSPKSNKKDDSKSSQGNVNGNLDQSLENRVKSPLKLQQSASSVKSVTNSAESPSTSTPITRQLINQTANVVKSDKDVTVSPIPKDIVEKTNELRNKISDFNVDSPKHRIQRNVAIANLLKLHSAKPSPSTSKSNLSTSTEEKEFKLITPDYYMKNTKDIPNEVNDEKNVIADKEVEADAENDVDTKSIQESIDKVNNWFEKPKSPVVTTDTKTSTVCMGPVSFKRKDPNGKSPTGSTVDKKVPKNNHMVQFKPSQYAADLAKKYTERSQAKERREMTIWDNLEKELKLKDEEIRKKRTMQDTNV